MSHPLLKAYLNLINTTSAVFSERTALPSLEAASNVLSRDGNTRERATADLLVAWLHFATGAVDWSDPVPLPGGLQAPYSDVIAEIESIILDPAATNQELRRASRLALRTRLAG